MNKLLLIVFTRIHTNIYSLDDEYYSLWKGKQTSEEIKPLFFQNVNDNREIIVFQGPQYKNILQDEGKYLLQNIVKDIFDLIHINNRRCLFIYHSHYKLKSTFKSLKNIFKFQNDHNGFSIFEYSSSTIDKSYELFESLAQKCASLNMNYDNEFDNLWYHFLGCPVRSAKITLLDALRIPYQIDDFQSKMDSLISDLVETCNLFNSEKRNIEVYKKAYYKFITIKPWEYYSDPFNETYIKAIVEFRRSLLGK